MAHAQTKAASEAEIFERVGARALISAERRHGAAGQRQRLEVLP
jgi:hypothetical protein